LFMIRMPSFVLDFVNNFCVCDEDDFYGPALA
jgi:hypothetical protein